MTRESSKEKKRKLQVCEKMRDRLKTAAPEKKLEKQQKKKKDACPVDDRSARKDCKRVNEGKR